MRKALSNGGEFLYMAHNTYTKVGIAALVLSFVSAIFSVAVELPEGWPVTTAFVVFAVLSGAALAVSMLLLDKDDYSSSLLFLLSGSAFLYAASYGDVPRLALNLLALLYFLYVMTRLMRNDGAMTEGDDEKE